MLKHVSIAWAVLLVLASTASADVVKTFSSTCLQNLGNPAAIEKSAKKQGFTDSSLNELFDGYIGERKKTDETVQVNIASKNSFECAVTTSDVANAEEVRMRFFQSLGISTKKSEVAAKVGDQRYTFKFDTQGGEALVVYQK